MMTDNSIQSRLSGWELPDEFTQGPAEQVNPSTQNSHPLWLAWANRPDAGLPIDLRSTLQLELDQLFCTRRMEEQLPALDWEELSGPKESWFGEF
ncbi:MAG: hypothetical protein ACAI44_25865 [Candidatus Sericytochromatia bacterium]